MYWPWLWCKVSEFGGSHDHRYTESIHVPAVPSPDNHLVGNMEDALVARREPHLFTREHHPASSGQPLRFIFSRVALPIYLWDRQVDNPVFSSVSRKGSRGPKHQLFVHNLVLLLNFMLGYDDGSCKAHPDPSDWEGTTGIIESQLNRQGGSRHYPVGSEQGFASELSIPKYGKQTFDFELALMLLQRQDRHIRNTKYLYLLTCTLFIPCASIRIKVQVSL